MTVANFIIAGTEKAGTTAVFEHLSMHPDVIASRRKETDFFRCGDGTLAGYAAHFPNDRWARVVMEASPGYLGEAERVVPGMRALVPEVRLLFVLRDPVERFHSSYHFHRGKLNLPPELGFGDYVDACLEYAAAAPPDRPALARRLGIGEWFLRVLPFGCYAEHLSRYFAAFPRTQLLVTFYDDLCGDPAAFMARLCRFLHIDPDGLRRGPPARVNATFSGRNRVLHRFAVRANEVMEPWLRPRPRLKSAVVRAYKRMNRAREGYERMSAAERERLAAFCQPYNDDLAALLDRPLPPGWCRASGHATRAPVRRGAVAP